VSFSLRPGVERGHFKNHWLDSYHSFSFGEYFDTQHMGYSDLRVLNQDTVQGGFGFAMHRHQNMEIVSWILQGKLEHRDSMGHDSVVGAGGVQRLSAGRGMFHGEFNGLADKPVEFLQIWLLPGKTNIEPSYEAKEYAPEALESSWVCIAGPAGTEGASRIESEAKIYASRLKAGTKREIRLASKRKAWVHLAKGAVRFESFDLRRGDGVSAQGEEHFAFEASEDSEILVFELR
jgi:redox-sensitive bicupin YhaK (pirin superfamily)